MAMNASGSGDCGRPQGSGNKQSPASLAEFFADTTGGDFRVHVIEVSAGEDVIRKIMSLVQNGPRGMCVLSANGTLSSATISQPGSSGDYITLEGQFEILSLNGSFTTSESGGHLRSRKGGFNVSLADPDGHVIGGGVGGPLVAARPVQTVVGSFIPNAKNHKRKKQQFEAGTVPQIRSVPNAAGRPNRQTSVGADASN